MKFIVVFAVLFTVVSGRAFAQQPEPSPSPVGTSITGGPAHQNLPVYNRPADQIIKIKHSQTQAYVRPGAKTRRKRFVNSLVGPFTLARQVARAGISTWQNSPEEWGDRWEGFGRRVASNFGKNIIKQSTVYGLDATLKVDSHFYRSQKRDAGSKLRNALISPVTSRTSGGKRVFSIPQLVGTYGSSIIAYEAWYPARYGYKNGLRNGTISLGLEAAYNIFKEFVLKK